MKKMILAIILTAVFTGAVYGQTTYQFGIKGGGGAAAINISGTDPLPGLDGGIFFGIKTSKKLTIQPELLFTTKGMEIDIFGLATYKWQFTYIEIPVLAKMYFSPEGDIRPALFGGPYVSFLSSAKAKWDVLFDVYEQETDIKDAFKSTEIGICVGGGLDWKVSDNGALILDLRVSFTLSDILDDRAKLAEDEDIILVGDESMRHVNFFLTVGYGFDFGGGGGM